MEDLLLMTAAGLVAGFVTGLTGVGTGIVMLAVIPLVLGAFHIPDGSVVAVTIANAVFSTMVSSASNIFTTIRRQHFYRSETLIVAGSAVVMSLVVFETIVKSSFYSERLFNGVLIVFLTIVMIQWSWKLTRKGEVVEKIRPWRLSVTGSLAGAIAALTGLGGGTVTIPFLNLWMKVNVVKAKSISYGTLLAISFWLTFNNLFLVSEQHISHAVGLIIMPMMLPAAVGILIGSPIGVVVGEKASHRLISILFLLLLSIVIIQKILAFAYAHIS